jgi:hypothetical protein
MLRLRAVLIGLLISLASTPVLADATLFAGRTTTPTARAMKGVAFGVGLVVVGFEFEYATTNEDLIGGVPELRTGMGNLLIQTPIAIARIRPYFTAGGGAYRERLGTLTETQIGVNSGGGVKVSLAGPLRLRLDYRLFKLRGTPLHSTVHRLYAGANLAF